MRFATLPYFASPCLVPDLLHKRTYSSAWTTRPSKWLFS